MSKPPSSGNTIEHLVELAGFRPLTIHFSLFNPPHSRSPAYVPRVLAPIGAFISVQVLDADGRVCYESTRPKIRLKLDPGRAESYLTLEPGYSAGVILLVEDLQLAPGDYSLLVRYSNDPYLGMPERPVGKLSYEDSLSFRVV